MLSKTKFSLRENVRLRLLKDMVSGLKLTHPNVPNFIMVLDPMTTRIVSSCIKMIEFLEEGVIAIERLELTRKPFPKMHAIYFITPSDESIDKILEDFKNPKDPQYGNVHLFFTNHVSNEVVNKMSQQKSLIERVLTFKELNLDFLSPEANLFHFDMLDSFPTLFSKPGLPEEKILEEKIAYKLSTVIPALFDFEKFQIIYNKNPNNVVAERVSKILKERIERFVSLKKAKDQGGEEPAPPVKMIVLDRSYDPLIPLLHDYYYQSLVYDLLDVKGDIVEFESEDNSGKINKRKAALTDKDELWTRFRHQFIGEVMVNLSKEFEEFVSNNKTAQTKKTDMSNLNLQQMSDIVKSMPQYQEILGKYTLHMNLIQDCVKTFEQQQLKELGDLEQSLATGIDGEGKALSTQKLIGMLTQRMAGGDLTKNAKIRLLLIATIAADLPDKDRRVLAQQLSKEEKEILYNLSWLGVNPNEASSKDSKSSKKLTGVSLAAKNKLKNISTDLLRHTSVLETIASTIVSGQALPPNYGSLFVPNNWDGSLKAGKPSSKSGGIITSLRKGAKATTNWNESSDERVQPRFIFFIIGGMSYAEARVLSDLEKNNPNITVIMGSTAMMKPDEYIEGLKNMISLSDYEDLKLKAK